MIKEFCSECICSETCGCETQRDCDFYMAGHVDGLVKGMEQERNTFVKEAEKFLEPYKI